MRGPHMCVCWRIAAMRVCYPCAQACEGYNPADWSSSPTSTEVLTIGGPHQRRSSLTMQHAPPVLLHAAHKETSNSPGHHFEAPSGIASSRVCLWPTAALASSGLHRNTKAVELGRGIWGGNECGCIVLLAPTLVSDNALVSDKALHLAPTWTRTPIAGATN